MATDPTIARDAVIRQAAFDHIRGLQSHDLIFSHEEIARGFMFEGERWPLWNPQRGIFKPREMPFLLSIRTVTWALENPDYKVEIMLGRKIEDPAQEVTMTKYLETVEVPDFDRAVAAGHELLDKYARETGEFGLEIYLTPPQLPHADEERLGIRHYKLSAEARKRARAIGIRGRDLEARIARMVRHAVPFEHRTANLRFRGIIFRTEGDVITWLDLAVPPRRRRRKAK